MRRVTAVLVCALALVAVGARADAHDPIILTADQTTPATGPGLPDGTISFALYGTLAGRTDTRGFRASLRAGQRLELTLLLPDLPPERDLADADLPFLVVVAPDGTPTELRPDRRETFAEAFSGTNYIRLLEIDRPVANAGEYGVTVTGTTAARFTVAIGSIERFGTPVDGVPNRSEGIGGVQRWYATPPAVEPAAASTVASTVASTTPAASTTPLGAGTTTSAPTSTSPTAAATTTTDAAPAATTTTTATTTPAAPANRARGTVVLLTVIVLAGGGRWFLRKRRLRRRER